MSRDSIQTTQMMILYSRTDAIAIIAIIIAIIISTVLILLCCPFVNNYSYLNTKKLKNKLAIIINANKL